jgi:hypothetical protein
MTETTELDTKKEDVSLNGARKSFDDDQALLKYISSKKPAEELVDIPEWDVELLCKALNSDMRIKVQIAAQDAKTETVDYRRVFVMIVIAGCYNPSTKKHVFTESSRAMLAQEQDGAAVEHLALVILRLSCMLKKESEQIKKN